MNLVDVWGLEIRLYSDDAFGLVGKLFGLNHAYLWSTKESIPVEMHGSFGKEIGAVSHNLNSPYKVINNLNGKSEADFIDKIRKYPGFNKGLWIPYFNDCFNQLEGAFNWMGIDYPGDLNGRLDFDNIILNILQNGRDSILGKGC